ncbi:hypothetical protein Tco_1055199 [Tanacetum coccineum]|uniref:Secreted protein n=1 Tax=Tanacetum coccineum TaxID=301880 RepID=A0ABQ5H107_9ASTR
MLTGSFAAAAGQVWEVRLSLPVLGWLVLECEGFISSFDDKKPVRGRRLLRRMRDFPRLVVIIPMTFGVRSKE